MLKPTKKFSIFDPFSKNIEESKNEEIKKNNEINVNELELGTTMRKCECKEYLKCSDQFTDYYIYFQCKYPLISGEKSLYCDGCMYALCGRCTQQYIKERPSRLVFSAHGDTCFEESFCHPIETPHGVIYWGHMDNYAGVYSMLSSYFGGSRHQQRIQYNITYGEEMLTNGIEYAGARDVIKTLMTDDMVIAIDVTGIESRPLTGPNEIKGTLGHVVFEKVLNNPRILSMISRLSGKCVAKNGIPIQVPLQTIYSSPYTYEIWDWCGDPQASQDESDIYRKHCRNTMFLGVPTQGGNYSEDYHSDGDYNEGPVFCWKKDIEAVSQVINELTNMFVESYPVCPIFDK